ncbi:MAG: NADH-quinone oxidoreductase subunit C [Polyangiaceae bacterium]|nr:NADH-quinone oxidoreductase subunit C [Polyangiaceae bacterium]
MSQKVLELLKAQFGSKILETSSQFGDDTAVVEPSAWREVAQFLRDDSRCAMNMFTDITAVDYPDRDPRFEVVCHLRSFDKGHRIRMKARIGDEYADGLEIASLVPVWEGANWFERECYDMFGVRFVGHPDLRRILMYEEFKGHPLRKDYPAQQTQPLVQYREGVLDKLAPFGADEGMPFGRQTHDISRNEEAN